MDHIRIQRRGGTSSYTETFRGKRRKEDRFSPERRRKLHREVHSQWSTERASSSQSSSCISHCTSGTDQTTNITTIWIIGSSYVHRGEKAAYEQFGVNFGLKAKVEWFGKGGLRWSGVLPHFYEALTTRGPPDILVTHAGGNDLGLLSAHTLAEEMTVDLIHLHKEFPSMTILFSCINERRAWRYGHPWKINNDRKMVNRLLKKTVDKIGGDVIEHPHLRFFTTSVYVPDGVHFSKRGNRIFLSRIHDALQRILLPYY